MTTPALPALPPDSELVPGEPVKAAHSKAYKDYVVAVGAQALADAQAPADTAVDAGIDRAELDGRLLTPEVARGTYLALADVDVQQVQAQLDAAQAEVDAALAEFNADLAAAVAQFGGVISSAPSLGGVSELRDYATLEGALRVYGVGDYYYSTTSTLADNGTTVVRPNSVAANSAGRWLRVDPAAPVLPFGQFGQRLIKARTGQFRVLQFGTSNSTFNSSLNQLFVGHLKDKYGDSQITTEYAGVLGGSFSDTVNGWVKQGYGGLLFVRSRGSSSSTPLTYIGFGDSITIEYSKETDGTTFQVEVDGSIVGSIDCNGAQAYSRKATFSFTRGPHSVRLLPPTGAGFAYLESVSYGDTAARGVTEVSPLKASALRNTIVSGTINGVAPIPTVGFNGVDAHFGRDDVDAIICMHLVNDAGQNTYADPTQWRDLVDRAIAQTRLRNTPLIWIIEIGGHYALPGDPNFHTFNSMREYLLQKGRENNHVFVLDLHGMTIHGDLTAWAAHYYPSATITNAAAGTFTGDFIHWDEDGHRIGLQALCALAGIDPSVHESLTEQRDARKYRDALTPNPNAVVAVTDGKTKTYNYGEGTALQLIQGSRAGSVPYYRDNFAVNYASDLNDQIATAGTSDAFGPFKTFTDGVSTPFATNAGYPFSAQRRLKFTLRARGVIIFGTNNINDKLYYQGQALTPAANGTTLVTLDLGATPKVITVEYGGGQGGNSTVRLAGTFYEICAVESTVPVLTTKARQSFREIGPPILLGGDPAFVPEYVGQHYIEEIGGIAIEKRLAGRVRKWDSATQSVYLAGSYVAVDRTIAAYKQGRVSATRTAVTNSYTGALAETSTAGPTIGFGTVPLVAGLPVTVMVRSVDINTSVTFLFINTGTNARRYVLPDGSFSSTNTAIRGLNGLDIGWPLAFTLTPTAQLISDIGANPVLDVVLAGGTNHTFATLVRGSSACF